MFPKLILYTWYGSESPFDQNPPNSELNENPTFWVLIPFRLSSTLKSRKIRTTIQNISKLCPPQTEPPSYSTALVLNICLLVIYFSDIYIAWNKLIANSLNKLATNMVNFFKLGVQTGFLKLIFFKVKWIIQKCNILKYYTY